MNSRTAGFSMLLVIAFLGGSGRSSKDDAIQMAGKEAGQVRDDNGLRMQFA